jgi:signal transduction histidine kinase
MDIYSRKSRWKIYMAATGVVILLISIFYTDYLSRQLAEGERYRVENFVLAQEQVNSDKEFEDLTLQLQIFERNNTIPVIITDERDEIIDAMNFGEERNKDEEYLKSVIQKLHKKEFSPIVSSTTGNKIYYQESILLRQLRYFPLIQLILIAAFVGLGYIGFSDARRSEQNRVWVGMAKETAHQLGTPISGIVAWLENLRAIKEEDAEVIEIVDELRTDVGRLELIAERFSKIGSIPSLEPVNIYTELEKCRAYMQRRASRKVQFNFPDPNSTALRVRLNPPLFDWVIENLLRNALDAMDGKGSIQVQVSEEEHAVNIDVIDSGKGIPNSKFKTVFQPGYTTKKRGWGLGLSLSKRIIEEYHSGKIFVKKSEEGKGTTFSIRLLKAA